MSSSDINYGPYFICFLISAIMAFIDVLPNYSIFHVKRGLGYKLIFSLLNGTLSIIVLSVLWGHVFTELDSNLKGLIFGLSYPTIMKSKTLLYDKSSPIDKNLPTNSISLEKIYNTMIIYCRELVDESDRQYITATKQDLATKYGVENLYRHLRNAIEDDPKLAREDKEKEKKELLNRIEEIKNDKNSVDIEKAESFARIIINKYPSDITKLRKRKI